MQLASSGIWSFTSSTLYSCLRSKLPKNAWCFSQSTVAPLESFPGTTLEDYFRQGWSTLSTSQWTMLLFWIAKSLPMISNVSSSFDLRGSRMHTEERDNTILLKGIADRLPCNKCEWIMQVLRLVTSVDCGVVAVALDFTGVDGMVGGTFSDSESDFSGTVRIVCFFLATGAINLSIFFSVRTFGDLLVPTTGFLLWLFSLKGVSWSTKTNSSTAFLCRDRSFS